LKVVNPGDGSPLRLVESRPVWLFVFLGLGPFGVYGYCSDFFAAEQCLVAAIALSILPGLLMAAGMIKGIRENIVTRRVSAFVLSAALWLLIPLLTISVWWAALGLGLPDLFTRFTGDIHRAEWAVHTEERGPGRSCRYRVFGEPFDDGGRNGYYCASRSDFVMLPAAKSVALVIWRESWFGRHIESVRPASPLK
jgi:hypothetical protein